MCQEFERIRVYASNEHVSEHFEPSKHGISDQAKALIDKAIQLSNKPKHVLIQLQVKY